ncbi:MAG: restriction endonuclease subunit M [Methanobrevibacter sp. CfCl-M3]
MEVPETIDYLVKKFENNIIAYKSPKYNETTVRQEFIDPFFEELGWDVGNKRRNVAPQYRDVILEDSIKVENKTKAPDYSFTLSGRRIFFLEAKKPSVDIVNDNDPVFQLKRYAWSAKLSLSVLTNFEYLIIYEIKAKPDRNNSTKVGRVGIYNFKDYVDKWDEIYCLLSKDAVLSGSFDRFAENTSKKGTVNVDEEFLKEIEEWRMLLARNIALRNPEISVNDLNYGVQQTIDRIVFLRMAEDRGIEPYEQLLKLLDEKNIYRSFGKLCHDADAKYNSGLFHFKHEKRIIQSPDEFTLDLNIDDGIFKKIFKNLYYPKSPYEFSVLSPEILGSIYEQFLGKVIRLTYGHRAKIEEKPEVKEAGGVFYTPQYIVDYIVENTIGKILKDKKTDQVSNLRIVDPACGSGSFLLGAYEYLLKWHIEKYSSEEKPPKETIYESKEGKLHLTIKKKKEILLNNIYGVDKDSQAVEVTKLSLLLKVLEDANKDVLEAQQKLYKERVLPFLGDNIKCGNSLIGTDILEQEELSQEEIIKINPFDWEDEFPTIFKNGGFDAVIGNPPYISIQKMNKYVPFDSKYYKNNYFTAKKDNYDIYVVFVEKALQLLNNSGKSGYILPHKFFNTKYGEYLRNIISNGRNLEKIVYFGDQQVFKKASTYTCLLFLNKKGVNDFKFMSVNNIKKWEEYVKNNELFRDSYLEGLINLNKLSDKEWIFVLGEDGKLFYKLNSMPIKLGSMCKIFQGLATSADKIYISPLYSENSKTSIICPTLLKSKTKIENGILKPLLRGAEISRYEKPKHENVLIFPYYSLKRKV